MNRPTRRSWPGTVLITCSEVVILRAPSGSSAPRRITLSALGMVGEAAAILERARSMCGTVEDELLLIDLIISAHHRANDWPLVVRTIEDFRRTARTNGIAEALHDELELLFLEAQWRTTHDHAALLPAAAQCTFAETASPQHRVRAAYHAMIVAEGNCDVGLIHRLYTAVEPFLFGDTVDRADALDLLTVYHTCYGDLDRAVECATEARRITPPDKFPALAARRLRHEAITLRFAGRPDESRARLQEAARIARKYGLVAPETAAVVLLATLAADLKRPDEAEAACSEAKRLNPDYFAPSDRIDVRLVDAQVALMRGLVADAMSHHQSLCGDLESRETTSWPRRYPRCHCTDRARRIRASLRKAPRDALGELRSDSRLGRSRLQRSVARPRPSAAGRIELGDSIPSDYLRVSRRDRGPLPMDLAMLANQVASRDGVEILNNMRAGVPL